MLWKEIEKLSEIGFEYFIGEIHLFYGYAGVGKTTFACYIPIVLLHKWLKENHMLSENTRYVVINTDNSFHFKDLERIARANGLNFDEIVNHIWLEKAQTFERMIDKLNVVFKAIRNNERDVKLIAVDKINDPYYFAIMEEKDRGQIYAVSREAYGSIEFMLRRLGSFADRYEILVTLSARKKKEKKDKPFKYWYQKIYAGYSIQYAPSVAVELDSINNTGSKVRFRVVKNRHCKIGGEVVVEFTEFGFKI